MKVILELILRSLVYSLIVFLIDFVLIVFIDRFNQIIYNLSFLMLFEGGIGLAVGGAAASYSPIGAKLSEIIFHSKPWNARRQREVEQQAKTWIVTGIFLIVVALSLSAI